MYTFLLILRSCKINTIRNIKNKFSNKRHTWITREKITYDWYNTIWTLQHKKSNDCIRGWKGLYIQSDICKPNEKVCLIALPKLIIETQRLDYGILVKKRRSVGANIAALRLWWWIRIGLDFELRVCWSVV